MREIKFRAWDRENKEMLDVQELDYQGSYSGQPMVRTTMYNDYFDTEDMILMQYTGLKDKNGKEIYEGDIVQFKGNYKDKRKLVVFWDSMKSGFFITPIHCYKYRVKEKTYLRAEFINAKNKEIIGNIYENPELLEEEL